MAWYNWSQTAASNATADPSVNWAEGQSPSSINDSARAMMAATAKYRDDIAGAIVTSGTSTAYTVSSYSLFDTLAHMNGQMIAFSPHTTNGATVTLNVDSLGAVPLRSSPGVELLAGTIIQGTPYVATYNQTNGEFYLQGFYGNPYGIPLLGGLDFWGTTAPNSSFIFPAGQAISRTTYATAFAIMSTTYGSGDGSTTFNVPDKRARVSAMFDSGDATGRMVGTYSSVQAAVMGSAGGAETHTLATSELAAHTHGATDAGHGHPGSTGFVRAAPGSSTDSAAEGNDSEGGTSAQALTIATGSANITIASAGSGNPHNILQPTIVCNYIIRII
jgi:microcystin-dependent protein